MKFTLEMVSKQSGRIGMLSKSDVEIKTPFVLHYTKVNISLKHSDFGVIFFHKFI